MSIQILNLVALVAATAPGAAKTKPFHFSGYYAEACSCAAPCPCELTGVAKGCLGVGAFTFESGSYDGKSIAGCRAAYATGPGEWVLVYVDAPTAAKRKTLTAMMTAALSGFGKIEAVKDAKITLKKKGDHYWGSIDGGKVCTFETTPTVGLDGKTPLTYSNVKDPLHPTVMQGNNVHTHFDDGGHSFDLKESNAYFNGKITAKGSL